MRLFAITGALALIAVSGNVYAQDAQDETSNDKTEESAATPDPEKTSVEDGTQVAQANSGSARRGGTAQAAASPDEVEEVKEPETKLPARVPWRGTAVSWGHSASASALGVGSDFQGSEFQSYTQSYTLGLNYFVIDKDKWSLAVATSPGFTVEMTNSAATTTKREPWFNDLPTQVVYRQRLYAHETLPLATGMVLNGTVLWPTSPVSQDSGTYLTTSPRLTLWQAVPLLPKDVSPVLNSMLFGVGARWNHRFGNSTVGVNDALQRPRMNLNGDNITDNALSGNRVGQENVREGAFVMVNQPIGPTSLVIFAGMGITQSYLGNTSTVDCVQLDTGCVGEADLQASGLEDARDWRFGYDFSIGGQFFPVSEAGLGFGYSNSGNQLGPDGRRQNVAYNPRTAQFSASIIVSLDAIYEGIIGPRRKGAFVLVGKNDKKRRRDDRKTPDKTLPVTF
jgi:hypothetical protein